MNEEISKALLAELKKGYKKYQSEQTREPMYETASFLVDHFWEQPRQLANGLGTLLLTWNKAYYRDREFDFKKLEQCLSKNSNFLTHYRNKHIRSASEQDYNSIKILFLELLAALAIADGRRKGTRTPVGAVKALHLLAPNFFPLWDNKIANAYKCNYATNPMDAYWKFFKVMQALESLLSKNPHPGFGNKTILKQIDEYNYARFTRKWYWPTKIAPEIIQIGSLGKTHAPSSTGL